MVARWDGACTDTTVTWYRMNYGLGLMLRNNAGRALFKLGLGLTSGLAVYPFIFNNRPDTGYPVDFLCLISVVGQISGQIPDIRLISNADILTKKVSGPTLIKTLPTVITL